MLSASNRQAVYPWLICASCLLMIFCTVGLCGNTLPVYYPFIAQEKGFNNAQISAITTIRCGFAFVSMGLLPRLTRQVRLRLLPLLTCLLIAASLFLMSVANALPVLYLSAAGIGLAYGVGSMVLVSVLVRNWFSKREGLALSLCATGSGLSNVVAAPPVTRAVETLGLAPAMRIEALAIIGIGLLMFSVIRDEPAAIGLRPYGHDMGEAKEATAAPAAALPQASISRRHRRLMILAVLFSGPSNITTASLFTMHYTQCGYSAMTIAAGLSMFGLVLTGAKLVYGWCNDRFGVYICNWVFLGLSVAANLLIAFSNRMPVGFVMFLGLALCALGYPPIMIGLSLWARDLLPAREYTGTVALYQQLSMLGGMVGTLIGGFSADWTGGYTCAYVGCAVCLLFTLFTVEYLYRFYGCRRRSLAAAPAMQSGS